MTTAQLTEQYIERHKSIKDCLKKGLVNYSSLARMIAKDLSLERKASKDAILIAARRYKEKIKTEKLREDEIRAILQRSELEIKNKVSVFVIEKGGLVDSLIDLEKIVRKNDDLFFSVEGTKSITVMISERYKTEFERRFKAKVISSSSGNAIVIIKSPKELEKAIGVLAYVATLFSDNDINIIESLSCWTDTIFVVKEADVAQVMEFMRF